MVRSRTHRTRPARRPAQLCARLGNQISLSRPSPRTLSSYFGRCLRAEFGIHAKLPRGNQWSEIPRIAERRLQFGADPDVGQGRCPGSGYEFVKIFRCRWRRCLLSPELLSIRLRYSQHHVRWPNRDAPIHSDQTQLGRGAAASQPDGASCHIGTTGYAYGIALSFDGLPAMRGTLANSNTSL